MAGTLVIGTISDGTNSTSSTNAIQGSAKAWVKFDGTTGTINAQYNVSSVTRNSTGDYTVNFTSALVDANYSTQLAAARSATNNDIVPVIKLGGTYTSSAVQFITVANSGYTTNVDASPACVAIFR